MPDNVVSIGCMTLQPIPVERVIAATLVEHQAKPFQRVTVIAVHEDGEEYFASSTADCGAIFWDMDRFRHERLKDAGNA